MPAKKKPSKSRAVALPLRGRAPGTPNKVSAQAKDNILQVFVNLGGVRAMTTWAKKNQDKFYTNIYARLLPKDVQVEAGQGLEELLGMLQQQRAEPESSYVVDGDYTEVLSTETVQ